MKRQLMIENCLFNDKIKLKSQQGFRSDHHEMYTKETNKIALSSNDGKTLQICNKITTYPYGTNAFKVRKSEMTIVRDYFVEKYSTCPFL